jgi:hypothetical protein
MKALLMQNNEADLLFGRTDRNRRREVEAL